MKYRASIASDELDRNGFILTRKALMEMVESGNNNVIPISINFGDEIIGHATNFALIDTVVICSFELCNRDMDKLNLGLVPGGIVRTESMIKATWDVGGKETVKLDSYTITKLGLVRFEEIADPSLTPISAIKFKEKDEPNEPPQST